MGAILEPTEAMGAYTVEVRRESFYLGGPSSRLTVTAESWSVPAEDASAVLASLDQVAAHPAYLTEARSFASKDGEAGGVFAVERIDDRITVSGRAHLYPCTHFEDEHGEQCQHAMIELEHRDLPELRRKLTSS